MTHAESNRGGWQRAFLHPLPLTEGVSDRPTTSDAAIRPGPERGMMLMTSNRPPTAEGLFGDPCTSPIRGVKVKRRENRKRPLKPPRSRNRFHRFRGCRPPCPTHSRLSVRRISLRRSPLTVARSSFESPRGRVHRGKTRSRRTTTPRFGCRDGRKLYRADRAVSAHSRGGCSATRFRRCARSRFRN